MGSYITKQKYGTLHLNSKKKAPKLAAIQTNHVLINLSKLFINLLVEDVGPYGRAGAVDQGRSFFRNLPPIGHVFRGGFRI
jgi:hypothetical protein